jgi:DNA-binding NarL/FixJ family response regulator
MIKVITADDHKLVRKGIIEHIKKVSDIDVVGEANDGKQLLSLLRNISADVILLDINMPGRSGIEIIKDIEQTYPDISILVVSFHKDSGTIINCLKNGALGYLNKDSEPKELINAIRKVYKKEKYIDQKLAGKVVFQIAENTTKENKHNELSQREFEVLIKLGNGKTVSSIANELNLSVKTVSTYRKRILDKLELTSNLDIIKYVVKNELD